MAWLPTRLANENNFICNARVNAKSKPFHLSSIIPFPGSHHAIHVVLLYLRVIADVL